MARPAKERARKQSPGRTKPSPGHQRGPAAKRWSGDVTKHSHALDLEEGVFTWDDPGRIAASLANGRDPGPPPLAEQGAIAAAHVEDMLAHHGVAHGLRNARKHIGWYLASSGRAAEAVKAWRRRLCTSEDARAVLAGLRGFYAEAEELAA